MKKKIISTELKRRLIGEYTNDRTLALMQGRRIENYSDEIMKSLERYSSEIEPVVLGYNRTTAGKTMAMNLLRASAHNTPMQNRKTHQDMVEGLAVECAKKLKLNVRNCKNNGTKS